MKNTFGSSVTVTLFGESHGKWIGATLDGLAPGIKINEENIRFHLKKRAPSGDHSSSRHEQDDFLIASGVKNGYTTGTPLTVLIPNHDINSTDYEKNKLLPRPGHADYTAFIKYHGYEDKSGGGHFSGRLTAALVAAGAVCTDALRSKGIRVGTHILRLSDIEDTPFYDLEKDIDALQSRTFPVLSEKTEEKMKQKILEAKENGSSVGGILETMVTGVPAGVGEPWFDTVEGVLSHALFSIPAVKGVEFGEGFHFADLTGESANDEMAVNNDRITHLTNRNGGVLGGITNGMPILFRCAVKPTPSIPKPQHTVNTKTMQNAMIEINGRHDPAIVHRAAEAVNAVTAICICDLLSIRFGTDHLAGEVKHP